MSSRRRWKVNELFQPLGAYVPARTISEITEMVAQPSSVPPIPSEWIRVFTDDPNVQQFLFENALRVGLISMAGSNPAKSQAFKNIVCAQGASALPPAIYACLCRNMCSTTRSVPLSGTPNSLGQQQEQPVQPSTQPASTTSGTLWAWIIAGITLAGTLYAMDAEKYGIAYWPQSWGGSGAFRVYGPGSIISQAIGGGFQKVTPQIVPGSWLTHLKGI